MHSIGYTLIDQICGVGLFNFLQAGHLIFGLDKANTYLLHRTAYAVFNKIYDVGYFSL